MTKIAVITNCTSTRTRTPLVKIADMPTLPQEQLLKTWVESIKAIETKNPELTIPPEDLYTGLSMQSVTAIANNDLVGFDNVFIVTGGQGLTSLTQDIVPYDFTINSNHEFNVHDHVRGAFSVNEWWAGINKALRSTGSKHPIADLLNDSKYKLVVVSVSKVFLKYITNDIVQYATPENLQKLRIIVTTKYNNTLPVQLHPFVLTFTKNAAVNSIGNRNDLPQRMCLRFLNMLDNKLINESAQKHQEAIDSKINKPGEEASNYWVLTAEEIFDKEPELLDMEPDKALAQVKRRYKIVGGTSKFRAEWLKRSTIKEHKAHKAPVSNTMRSAALSALKNVSGDIMKTSSKMTSWKEEQNILKELQLFTELVKEEMPDAKFTSTEVYKWLEAYYNEQSKSIPIAVNSVGKVAHILSNYHEVLNLEKLKVQGVGAIHYTLLKP